MTNALSELSQRKAARIAGVGYLIIIVAGILAEFFIRSNLIVPGDAAATASNITQSEGLFRVGIAGDLIMLLADVVVALALYIVLAPVSKSVALLAAFLRLVHSAVVGASLLNLTFVLHLLGGGGHLTAFEPAQLNALVLVFLNGHSDGYVLGLIFFGLHCVVLGYLVYQSGFIPRLLGILLVVAACGYLVDGFAHVLLSNYADYGPLLMVVVFVPALVAELSFSLWLVLKGRTIPEG